MLLHKDLVDYYNKAKETGDANSKEFRKFKTFVEHSYKVFKHIYIVMVGSKDETEKKVYSAIGDYPYTIPGDISRIVSVLSGIEDSLKRVESGEYNFSKTMDGLYHDIKRIHKVIIKSKAHLLKAIAKFRELITGLSESIKQFEHTLKEEKLIK